MAEGECSPKPVRIELLCARCGYDLRGLDASGKCPECSEPVAWSLPQGRHCLSCGHDLGDLPDNAVCPNCKVPVETSLEREGAAAPIQKNRPCLSCGYNLRGLLPSGVCPECGTSIARSLRGNLLKYSGAEYLLQLHNGVFAVQASIVFQFLGLIFGFAGAAIVAGPSQGSSFSVDSVHTTVNLVTLGSSLISLAGWWLLSAPDPAVIGTETGTNARKVLRVSVFIYAGAAAAGALCALAHVAPFNPRNPRLDTAQLLPFAMMLVSWAGWVVWFFAAINYLWWLAPRIPNFKARNRAKTMMWLGPVLWIFGCGVGQLVALVMYYNLLDWIRIDLKAIRAKQAEESPA